MGKLNRLNYEVVRVVFLSYKTLIFSGAATLF